MGAEAIHQPPGGENSRLIAIGAKWYASPHPEPERRIMEIYVNLATVIINLIILGLCLKLYTEYYKDKYKK